MTARDANSKHPQQGVFVSKVSTVQRGPMRGHFDGETVGLIERARHFVEKCDRHDGHSQAYCPIDMGLRTVMTALEAGLNMQRWDTVAEAFIMLQQIEQSTREEAKPIPPRSAPAPA